MALLEFVVIFSIAINCINGEISAVSSETGGENILLKPIKINGYCDISKNCSDYHTVCVDNYCRCKPDYKWNPSKNQCDFYDCVNSGECQREGRDENRVCESNFFGIKGCKCVDGYKQDSSSFKCLKLCENITECAVHEYCVDFRCRCKANYRWNLATNNCQRFYCANDIECHVNGDRNRYCHKGKCVCNIDYEEDKINNRCYLTFIPYTTVNSSSHSGTLWIWILILIPTVFLCYAFLSFNRQRSITVPSTVMKI